MPHTIKEVTPQFKILAREYDLLFEILDEEKRYTLFASGIYEGLRLEIKTYFEFQELTKRYEEERGEWITQFVWYCNNPEDIHLKLYPECLWQKIKKVFGMQDLSSYNEEFDKHFIIQSNNKLFILTAFPDNLSTELLAIEQLGGMGTLEIQDHGVHYKGTEHILSDAYNRDRLSRLIQVAKKVADRVHRFKNPEKD